MCRMFMTDKNQSKIIFSASKSQGSIHPYKFHWTNSKIFSSAKFSQRWISKEKLLWIFEWKILFNQNLQIRYEKKYGRVTRGQFHQQSMCSFWVRKFHAQLFWANILGLYFTAARLLVQKLCIECWWNWPLMINFEILIPFLCHPFMSRYLLESHLNNFKMITLNEL